MKDQKNNKINRVKKVQKVNKKSASKQKSTAESVETIEEKIKKVHDIAEEAFKRGASFISVPYEDLKTAQSILDSFPSDKYLKMLLPGTRTSDWNYVHSVYVNPVALSPLIPPPSTSPPSVPPPSPSSTFTGRGKCSITTTSLDSYPKDILKQDLLDYSKEFETNHTLLVHKRICQMKNKIDKQMLKDSKKGHHASSVTFPKKFFPFIFRALKSYKNYDYSISYYRSWIGTTRVQIIIGWKSTNDRHNTATESGESRSYETPA
jgi:hypothetical protein